MEARPEHGKSLKKQRTEELPVQILRKRMRATLKNAQVPTLLFAIIIISLLNCGSSVDCKVGDWSAWGDCSVTCAGGSKTRARDVIEDAKNGGAACSDLEETEMCNTEECPGTLSILAFSFSSYLY